MPLHRARLVSDFGVNFVEESSLWSLLERFTDALSGYVLYEPNTSSQSVAFSLSGVLGTVAISPDLSRRTRPCVLYAADARRNAGLAAAPRFGWMASLEATYVYACGNFSCRDAGIRPPWARACRRPGGRVMGDYVYTPGVP